MRKAGVDVTYVELPSDKGHMASHADAGMWAPILGAFMKTCDGRAPSAQDLAALLRWYVDQGLDEPIGEEAVDRFAAPRQRRAETPRQPLARTRRRAAARASSYAARAGAARIAATRRGRARPRRGCTTLAELEAAVRAFEGCALKRTAKNTVFADGTRAGRS